MTKNPFYNAGTALLYIILVVTGISIGGKLAGNSEGNYLIPIGMLSLFVLSAAIMAYIFLYKPIIMLLEGKRKEAIRLFISTIAVFAGITFIVFLIALIALKLNIQILAF